MKCPRLLLVIFLCCAVQFLSGQTIADSTYHNRIYYLTKIWGYTKYFHPAIAQCKVWDSALLTAVALTKTVENEAAFNSILVDMVKSAGEIEEATSPAVVVAEESRYNLDESWFNDALLGTEIRTLLNRMKDNYRPRRHCLVGEAFPGGNPTFAVDNRFYDESIQYPTESQRILAIARYWNIINYYFPYKYQMDIDWDVTLKDLIPSIVSANNALAYHLSFKELTTRINDSHSFFRSQTFFDWRGRFLAPFLLKYVEGKTVITKVHASVQTKLTVGDVITHIDGEAIETRRSALRKYVEGSNEVTIDRNINNYLRSGPAGVFTLEIENATGKKTVELTRQSFNQISDLFETEGNAWTTLPTSNGCDFGYVDLAVLESEEVPTMFNELRDYPAIIIDIRNYPNGTLWQMVDYLYTGPINFSAFTSPDIEYPGTLEFYQHSIGRGGSPYQGKLILLFDEETQSQAEFTIMGLEKHPGAIKVGSQTAGADGNVSTIDLPGGIRAWFSGLGVFYPDGTETQRIGIVPDITITPTVEGIRNGVDEVLTSVLDCSFAGISTNISEPEEADESSITISPNPFKERVFVTTTISDSYTVKVTDMLGRFIESFQVTGNTLQYPLTLSSDKKGIYFLIFEGNDGIITTKKVVKL